MKNAINWFEIPVNDFPRAKAFYEAILDISLEKTEMEGAEFAVFPADMENGGVGGCIMKSEGWVPSDKGSIVYLNGGDDLNTVLGRVESAGGKVEREKFAIKEHAFIAYFLDTEGNKVALHSMK